MLQAERQKVVDLKVDPEKQKAFSLEEELQVVFDRNNSAISPVLLGTRKTQTTSLCAETAGQRRHKQIRKQACAAVRD